MKTIHTVHAVGERQLIRLLSAAGPIDDPRIRVGPGDDAAVIAGRAGTDLVLKCDAVVEGVHFLPDTDPVRVGHKAAGRVLSDFAAMGARPLFLLVSLAAPPETKVSRIQLVYRGLRKQVAAHGCAIVGGETVQAAQLALHVFGLGEVPRNRALRRSTARPGDVLFVTGALGGSLAGRHLRFQPRVAEGVWLLAGRWATAAIDVSDGLAADLRHLVRASGVGADLDPARIPIASAAKRLKDGLTALEHALRDGEDFELLFSVRRARVPALLRAWRRRFKTPLSAIGAIVRAPGIRLRAVGQPVRPLVFGGYEHFI